MANFVQPLAVALDGHHAFALPEGETNEHCPGVGRAAIGYFCAYLTEEEDAYLAGGPNDPSNGEEGTGKDGAVFFFYGDGNGLAFVYGTWAVTAP